MKDYKKIVQIPVEKIKISSKEDIKISDVRLNYYQISIQERGGIRPFIVTKIGDDYIFENYFIRFTAMKLLGYKTLPCGVISERERERRIMLKRRLYSNYVI